MQAEDGLREELIGRYMPLVRNLTRRYQGRGIPQDDLLQAGRIGLNRAIDKYEAQQGGSFFSLARRWINHSIERAVWHDSLANGMSHRDYRLLCRTAAIRNKLTSELGREPNIEELSNALELPIERIETLTMAGMPTVSLDQMMEADNAARETAAALAQDENTPDKILERKELRLAVRKAVQQLPKGEQAVISLRYGFDDDSPRRLREIAAELKVSTPRIKQIEQAALGKLKVRLR